MLRSMRSNLKALSWTLWLVILAFVGFIFVEWGMGTNAIGADSKNYIMLIDDNPITMQDLKFYQTLFNWKNPQTLEMLKQNGILFNEAQKLNMTASAQELESQIFDIFQYKGVFIGMDQYRAFLSRNNINIKAFETFIKKFFVLPKKYISFYNSGKIIDDSTLKYNFKKERDYADIDYIKVLPEWIKDEITITDKERKDYYEKNKNKYFSPEKRKGLVVVIKLDKIRKNNLVTEKEIEEYYKNNLNQFQKKEHIRVSRIFLNYTKKNKKDIEALAKDLKQHLTVQNFSQKAKEFSQDEKSSIGGDWGFDLNKLIKKERKIARSMEVNQISDLIYTGKSISILHVTEKSKEKIKPLSLVKNIIKDKLEPEKLKSIAKKKIDEITKILKKTNKIEKIISDDVIVKKTDYIKKDQIVLGLDESSTLSNKLFGLKLNTVSEEIELIQNAKRNYGIVKCIEIKKAGIAKFEAVRNKLDKDIIKVKKSELLKTKAPLITKKLNELKDKKKIEEYLKSQKLISDTFRYKRGNKLLDFPKLEGLDKTIFSLQPGIYNKPFIFKNAAVIVKLNSKKITTDDEFENSRISFYKSTLQRRSNLDWQAFLTAKFELYKNQEKIKINTKIYKSLINQKK